MKKIIALILIINSIIILPIEAADNPEKAVEDYYKACESNNVESILSTMDLEYIDNYIADLELYEMYVEAALQTAQNQKITVSNINLNIDEKNGSALGVVDVLTEGFLLEDNSELSLDNTFIVYLNKTNEGWKVAFTMEKEIYDLEIEKAQTEQYLKLTDDIAENDIDRHISSYNQSTGELIVNPDEVDMEGAVVTPEELESEKEEENTINEEKEETDQEDYTEFFEDKIEEYEKHERRTSLIKFIPIFGVIGVAGVFGYFKFFKK